MCLFLAVPASARARKLYLNVELSQAYYASQPTGEHWQSTATVSAYYRTTTQALASGDGTLELAPTATLGRFAASLANPVLGPPVDCTWHGAPGGGVSSPSSRMARPSPTRCRSNGPATRACGTRR